MSLTKIKTSKHVATQCAAKQKLNLRCELDGCHLVVSHLNYTKSIQPYSEMKPLQQQRRVRGIQHFTNYLYQCLFLYFLINY